MTAPVEPTRDVFDAGGRGVRHRGLRRANEKAVLTVIGFNAGVSNAEISRLSGLAPQTVSAILVDLEAGGLIERGPVLRGRRGQPATPIQLRADGGFAIGVELSWTHMDALLIGLHAQVLGHRRITYDYPDARTVPGEIARAVADLSALLAPEQRDRLQDIGVAMPGDLLDNLDLVGAPEEQRALWQDTDIAAFLKAASGLEISVFNDGNAACWAELIALPRPRPANVIYFLVSRYVAAGIVGDGALWEGPSGNAANLGAMLVQIEGVPPQEAHFVASQWALDRQLEEAGTAADTAAELERWIAQSAKALALVTFNTLTVVESPIVIIDSVLDGTVSAELARRLQSELAALPVRGFRAPRVLAGTHGRLAPAIGAAELPLFRRYF